MLKRLWYILPILVIVICILLIPHGKKGLHFNTLKGIKFTEAKRVFNNGLVFDGRGYQLEPLWKLYFLSDDSVMVFSPRMKKYYGFHVYFDHDSVFNMVDAWFKLKKMNQDSLMVQSLKVVDKVILDDDEGSKVLLTFYSDKYLKGGKVKNAAGLGLPGRRDTLFIAAKTKQANSHMDSAFAAREPVILKSKSGLVNVEKVVSVSTPFEKVNPAIDYLSPEYNITINKAYENFDYSFSAFVDWQGKIYFRKSLIPYPPEFEKTYTDVIKGIIDGYLKLYLDVTPGKTLGIAHTTIILLNVNGKHQ